MGLWRVPLCLALSVAHLCAQPAFVADPKYWTPDGPVTALLVTNETIYLGGEFSYLGPRTGPAGLFDTATGRFLAAPPRIEGTVYAIQADGVGGWFLGGNFTRIGDTAVSCLARLNPDLSLDEQWQAGIVGTSVYALALDRGRLCVGGQFQTVHGQKAAGLVGLRASDASLAWQPNLSGSVYTLQAVEDVLYVGGKFTSVGASNRVNLAAIALDDTALATAWNPGTDQSVLALAATGDTVYVGGQFTRAGTKPRNRLAALAADTGVATGWNPNPNGTIRVLAIQGTTLYVGGEFTSIATQARRGFAALDLETGATLALDLHIAGSTSVDNLVRVVVPQTNALFLGGAFTNLLGARQRLLAGVDLATGGSLPVPQVSDFNGASGAAFGINAMARWEGLMLVGGSFQTMGGVARQRGAALSLATGVALPWAPAFYGPVLTLAYGSNVVYAGGGFTNVNGTRTVRGLAALDPANGEIAPFEFLGTNQTQVPTLRALTATPGALYAGGLFTVVGDQKRRFLAALDPHTGAPLADFDAKLGGGTEGVHALTLADGTLFVGGDFTTVNAKSVPRLTAVAALDGAALPWIPGPNKAVHSLDLAGDRLYVGGTFTQIGGVALRYFAAYNLADRSLVGLDAALPSTGASISAIAVSPVTVYVAGAYTSIGGEFRNNLACLAAENLAALGWDPAPDQAPGVLALTEGQVLLGGSFRYLGRSPTNRLHAFLAVFTRSPSILSHTRASPSTLRIVSTTGDRREVVLQQAEDLGRPDWVDLATNGVTGFPWATEVPISSVGQRYFRTVAR